MLDCLIIGAGPAGLAVANTFNKEGFKNLVVEKGSIADHVAQYPTFMQFFSTKDLVEIDNFPLTITDEKPSRRQYLAYLSRFVQDRKINVRSFTTVKNVVRDVDGGFSVTVQSGDSTTGIIKARSVVVACGAFNNPRMLNVPGEELEKVTHHFKEAHPYVGNKVLVVGGRNSAIEIALHLWRCGADVSLSYRRKNLDGYGIKYWLLPDIKNRLENNEIHGYTETTIERIDWKSVTLKDNSGEEFVIENDLVIACTGFDPPVNFLESMGIDIEAGTNIPQHDPVTLETNIPGLFVAGTITAGNVSGHVFIENSRHHGELIAKRLRELLNCAAV